MFEANKFLVVRREAIGIVFPPAPLGGILGEVEQPFPPCSADLVIVEQLLDFLQFQAGSGQLIPADLRW